ncbi:MAG: CopG family transcriptional regulator [bacterium]|nr:CopG family transcriptional regulator [bacterium]
MSETTQLMVEVPVAVEERLEEAAQASSRSKRSLIQAALIAFLDLYDWQTEAIEAGIADADAGRVVDHHAVAAWLESWGSEKELPPPRCD